MSGPARFGSYWYESLRDSGHVCLPDELAIFTSSTGDPRGGEAALDHLTAAFLYLAVEYEKVLHEVQGRDFERMRRSVVLAWLENAESFAYAVLLDEEDQAYPEAAKELVRESLLRSWRNMMAMDLEDSGLSSEAVAVAVALDAEPAVPAAWLVEDGVLSESWHLQE